MWYREFKDYPPDSALIQEQVEPSHGIVGCEMHELNGWGESFHRPVPRKKRGFFSTLFKNWFGSEEEEIQR